MSVARLLLFVVLMTVALGGINLQVFRWARNSWRLSGRTLLVLKLVLILAPAGMVIGRVAGRFWPSAGLGSLIAVASTVELAVVIAGILLLAADAARLLARLADSLRRRLVPHAAPTPPPAISSPEAPIPARPPHPEPAAAATTELTRRSFLAQATAGSAFLIGGGSSMYGALKGRHDYVLEEVAIRVPGLPRALDGFSIAQLSDVHIGVYVGEPELNIAEALLRRAKADLIVLTGDLLDNDPRLAPQLGRFVRRLQGVSREGVVAISGNHDYFAGVEDTALAITAGGGRMLRNDALMLGDSARFALLGVDDVWARREGKGQGPNLQRALAALPRIGGRIAPALDMPRVLLCHNPSYFAEAAGHVALQLSGHTHGGQVNLGIRPADYVLPGGWVAGRYDSNGSVLYVNRGFGTVGPPARVGAPPEVTRIVLTA